MLKFGNVSDIWKTGQDEAWIIMRSLRGVPAANIPVRHVPELSPSPWLFGEHRKLKMHWKWDRDAFESFFRPAFLKEMGGTEALSKLMELYSTGFEKDVLCACRCMDESFCHRSIVREILSFRAPETFYCLVAGTGSVTDHGRFCRQMDRTLWNHRGNVRILSADVGESLEKYASVRDYPLEVFGNERDAHEAILGEKAAGTIVFTDGEPSCMGAVEPLRKKGMQVRVISRQERHERYGSGKCPRRPSS